MNIKKESFTLILTVLLASLPQGGALANAKTSVDPFWQNATIYFLLVDRFNNGSVSNDHQFSRKNDGAVLRNFMGGDIRGVTQKIEEGYFDKLGVNALWLTPVYEQIHGYWDDEWGRSYPFHGYWMLDWTSVDPNFGTEQDLKDFIATAHRHGIRVLADVVLNHTGPQTKVDPPWPEDWTRRDPICKWGTYAENVSCSIANSVSDIYTESNTEVALPDFLLKKWENEGRKERELAELDNFFVRSKLPRAPKNYLIKWLTDWVRDYGIDGFRVDTAKHVEEGVWLSLKAEAELAFEEWKKAHPKQKLDDKTFYMIGEVYNFGLLGFSNTVENSRLYDYGDKQVDFFNYGFDGLINMGFPTHAQSDFETLYSSYSKEFHGDQKTEGPFNSLSMMSYLASHDDGKPYDQQRSKPYEAALKLMLAPGAVQIYYGDELARSLTIKGTTGDATLRSFMNWEDLQKKETQQLLEHWQKLGTFRSQHLAVGAGVHHKHNDQPYIFSRTLNRSGISDKVLVILNANKGKKNIDSYKIFADGIVLKDYYSGKLATVKSGLITLDTQHEIVLLGETR